MDVLDKLGELRGHYGDGRFDQAAELYHRNLGAPDPEWHLLGALSNWRKRDHYPAREAAERGLGYRPTGVIQAKLHFIYGVVLREVGEIVEAIVQFDTCQSLLTGSPELHPILWGPLHYNRGLARSQTADQRQAIADYSIAIAEFRQENMGGLLTMALLNYCWAVAEGGHADEAQAALDEAWPHCTTGNQQWAKQMHQAHIYAASKRYTEALHLCQVLDLDPETPPEIKCLASVVAARVAMAQELWDEAEHLGKAAVYLACLPPMSVDSRCLIVASQALQEAREMRAKTRGA